MAKDYKECIKNGGSVEVKYLKDGRKLCTCYDEQGHMHGFVLKEKESLFEQPPLEENTTVKIPIKKEESNIISPKENLEKTSKEELLKLQIYFNSHFHIANNK